MMDKISENIATQPSLAGAWADLDKILFILHPLYDEIPKIMQQTSIL